MTTEEKIDQIHDIVIGLKADYGADKKVCIEVHKGVDARIAGLHRVIKGNGQPGLEQKHQDLADRFNRLETKVIIWASVAVVVGQILAPKLLKMVGW